MAADAVSYVFKCIVVGDPAVGKSSLLNQFLHQKFSSAYELTVGMEFGAKTVELGPGRRVKLQIWDTAGQESFKSLTRSYYRSAAIAVIVYDITSRATFEHAATWLEECRHHGSAEMCVVLVGNKGDAEGQRAVPREEAEAFATTRKLIFCEASAKTSANVESVFVQGARAVEEKIRRGTIDPAQEQFGVRIGSQRNTLTALPAEVIEGRKRRRECCK